jgi:hypothetical protein
MRRGESGGRPRRHRGLTGLRERRRRRTRSLVSGRRLMSRRGWRRRRGASTSLGEWGRRSSGCTGALWRRRESGASAGGRSGRRRRSHRRRATSGNAGHCGRARASATSRGRRRGRRQACALLWEWREACSAGGRRRRRGLHSGHGSGGLRGASAWERRRRRSWRCGSRAGRWRDGGARRSARERRRCARHTGSSRRGLIGSSGERCTRAIASLACVLLHSFVDQIVDGAFELASHLFEGFPQYVAALKTAGTFLIRITHECALIVSPKLVRVESFEA